MHPRLKSLILTAGLALGATAADAAGLLVPRDGSAPPLELKEHHVQVVIEDGYAVTAVEQVFHNPHGRDLEATYSFPVPKHGSVGEFVVWIDGKPVVGEVLPKPKAREVYQQEKAAGRDAGIAEQDGYKTFDISVSPVRAGQDTRVRLRYYQSAHVDTGIGRYVYPLEEGGVDEEKMAFWESRSAVSRAFSFDLKLRSGYPVDAVRLPSFPDAQLSQTGPGEWQVRIERGAGSAPSAAANGEGNGVTGRQLEQTYAQAQGQPAAGGVFDLSQDIVVYWRHQPGLPGSVDLVAYKPDAGGRGSFMLTVTPGEDLKPIQEGRDWVFVLDISGSMAGKYHTLAQGVEQAIRKLPGRDRYRVVLFNDHATELTSGYQPATPENAQRVLQALSQVQVGSGTNLYAGLEIGLRGLEADRTSGIVLVTDGVANIGPTAEKAFLELLARKDVRLFTFILGNSANVPLLESLTKASHGFALSISNGDDIVGQVMLAASKLSHEALHGVEVRIHGVKVSDLTPARIGSLHRGEQLVLLGHYFGAGEAEIELTGKRSGTPVRYHTRFAFPAQTDRNPEIERLWAYAHIQELRSQMEQFGEDADRRQAIVDTALEYGLVTDYTSMVVLREEQYAQYDIDRRNRDRVSREAAAAALRATSPVRSNRVDSQQPMYSNPRPSLGGGGGGGSADWLLITALGLATLAARRGRRGGN